MLNKVTESHFAAWPETDVSPDGNAIVLKGKYIFPELPDRTGFTAIAAFFVMVGFWFLWAGAITENPVVTLFGGPIVCLLLAIVLGVWLTKHFSRRLDVQISPQAITIDKKVYDR